VALGGASLTVPLYVAEHAVLWFGVVAVLSRQQVAARVHDVDVTTQ
jgi:hypothetical protein